MGRDDDGEPILLVDEDSRRRRANYSRGNFSVTSSPQQRGHQGSLDQAFASGSLAVEDPVSPTFALALYSGVLSRMSRALGPLDILSRGCRPSRTAYLLLVQVMWVHRAVGGDSGEVIGPFMHVGTYPTRHLATLRESELLPAFSGPSPG